jgi:hypothetical protein
MEDTWTHRDLPVLEAAVRLLEDRRPVMGAAIAEATGLDPAEVGRALDALEGRYIAQVTRGLGPGPGNWHLSAVTSAAREAVGQWPSPESLVARLAQGFETAADQEENRGQRKKIRQVAAFLGGTGKDVAIEIVAKVIVRTTGMG